MQIDLRRRLTPSATLVGEVADQFLVLGIDTDDRIAYLQELLSHTTNVVKLAVASGCTAPVKLLRLATKPKPSLRSSRPTVVRPILYACARSRDAIVRKLSFTHFCSSVGEPAMSSLTISLILSSIATFFSSAGTARLAHGWAAGQVVV